MLVGIASTTVTLRSCQWQYHAGFPCNPYDRAVKPSILHCCPALEIRKAHIHQYRHGTMEEGEKSGIGRRELGTSGANPHLTQRADAGDLFPYLDPLYFLKVV
jgi:hypothetical protein